MPVFKMEYPTFTDFNPSCSLNAFLQAKFKTKNSHEYRYYLQHNAENIQKYFAQNALKDYKGCTVCPNCAKALDFRGQPLTK
jgi:hypothetical protein